MKFSVCSGGHSPNLGWFSVNDTGIVINLQRINQLIISPDSLVISLGPGLQWGAVYNALDPCGVSVIGGRIPQVAFAGLILGGSSSLENRSYRMLIRTFSRWILPFSGECGLAAENAKNFEVLVSQQSEVLRIDSHGRLSS